MMTAEYRPHQKVGLRDTGKDERWLQAKIAENPSILGLGDLTLFRKELRQSAGGRLDMLLTDPESDTMYEVEIMLGATDPSHIIRSIEYWDVESRRYAGREHIAVLIAEKITNRFFNVIWLLSRSIPMIAIQLDALVVESSLLLNFTKVLDLYEAPEVGDDQAATADKKSWDEYAPEAMKTFDRFLKLLVDNSLSPKLNYRQDGIALAGKWNFAKVVPLKSGPCLLTLYGRLPQDLLQAGRNAFEAAGVSVKNKSNDRFAIRLDDKAMNVAKETLLSLVRAGISLEG